MIDELWRLVDNEKKRQMVSFGRIAKLSGGLVKPQTVHRIIDLKMKNGLSLHPDTKHGLVRWLGDRVRPLLGNLDEAEQAAEHDDRPLDAIPLINKLPAAYGRSQTDKGFPEHWAEDWIPRGISPEAKAYIVDGDSMEPEFRVGDICVVDPTMDAQSGMACLVQLGPEHNDENLLRYVQFDQNRDVILRPGNQRMPLKSVKGDEVAYIWPVTEIRRKPEWVWK